MFRFLSLCTLLMTPVVGQFGVGNRKQAQSTHFEELQELAKKQASGGSGGSGGILNGGAGGGLGGLDMGDMQKLLADAMNDPKTMEQIMQYGQQFSGVLDQMMKMSPEELAQQMEQAMKMMTEGDIVDKVLDQKETVLKALEASGTVTPDELAKYHADPQYFELKMRESFDTMKDVLANPEYISKATEAMKSIKGLMDDPSKIAELTSALGTEWTSDDKIEEVRLQFLRGDFDSIPGLSGIFQTEEMQEILADPVRWKETVKDGIDDLLQLGTAGLTDQDDTTNSVPTTNTFGLPRDEL